MNRTSILSLVIGAGVSSIVAAAVAAQAPAPAAQPANVATIEKVRDNLFVIMGGGGNTAAFVTAKGVVLVDSKNPGWGQAILDKVRTVTDKPVTHIINTHTHGDHVGSNEFFPANVEVVAHEQTAANMMKMPSLQGPDKKHAHPDRTYKDRLSLLAGPERIDLYYFGRGHTNGDTFVVFPALQTVHTGDIFARLGAPLLDMNNGGSGVDIPETLAKAVKGISGVQTVIPGHSPVTDWKAFGDYAEFNRAFLDAVRAAKKAGKTADQAAAELTLPDRFKSYDMSRAKENVAKVFAELP